MRTRTRFGGEFSFRETSNWNGACVLFHFVLESLNCKSIKNKSTIWFEYIQPFIRSDVQNGRICWPIHQLHSSLIAFEWSQIKVRRGASASPHLLWPGTRYTNMAVPILKHNSLPSLLFTPLLGCHLEDSNGESQTRPETRFRTCERFR